MSGTYYVKVRGRALEELRSLNLNLSPKALNRIAGVAGVQAFRDHFTEKERNGGHAAASRLGARPVGLFAQFARGTHFEEQDFGPEIVVSHPAINQRIYGGRIRPVNGKYLTIPANSYAYGRRARELGINLVFAYAPLPGETTMVPALVAPEAIEKEVGKARKDGTRRKKTVKPAGVYFWLVREVNQDGDETTVPDGDAVKIKIIEGIGDYANEKIAEASRG